jgi:hypothetical protein
MTVKEGIREWTAVFPELGTRNFFFESIIATPQLFFSPLYVYSILKLNTFIQDNQTRHSYTIQSPQSFFELQEKCKCFFEITKPTVKVSSVMIMLATMQAEIPAFMVRHSRWWRRRWRRRRRRRRCGRQHGRRSGRRCRRRRRQR